MDLLLIAEHQPLVRCDLEIAEAQPRVSGLCAACSPEQCPDARGQLLRRERLREVVVGARFEAGDHVVGVGAGRDHHDRHVARLAQRAAQLEPVDPREHDVDEDHIGGLAAERLECVLSAGGLLDDPSLVLERHLHGCSDALVVLNGEDPGSHSLNGAA